jgi:Ferritin-like domain
VTRSLEDHPHSRRTLLVAGAATTAGLLAACSGSKPLRLKVRTGVTVQRGDVSVLNGLLDLEQRTIAAYAAGIPLLQRPAAKAAQQFLAQEMAHAQALSDLVKKAGGKPDKPRSSYELGNPTTGAAVLRLLRGLEDRQLSAYLAMTPLLTPGKLRAAVAAIFANDAQHVAVLREHLGEPAVPAAFVTGG